MKSHTEIAEMFLEKVRQSVALTWNGVGLQIRHRLGGCCHCLHVSLHRPCEETKLLLSVESFRLDSLHPL